MTTKRTHTTSRSPRSRARLGAIIWRAEIPYVGKCSERRAGARGRWGVYVHAGKGNSAHRGSDTTRNRILDSGARSGFFRPPIVLPVLRCGMPRPLSQDAHPLARTRAPRCWTARRHRLETASELTRSLWSVVHEESGNAHWPDVRADLTRHDFAAVSERGSPYGRGLGIPPRSGPGGGLVHRVSGWRSIDGETFARLIRDRWVGSRGDVTEKLFEILARTVRAEDETRARQHVVEPRFVEGFVHSRDMGAHVRGTAPANCRSARDSSVVIGADDQQVLVLDPAFERNGLSLIDRDRDLCSLEVPAAVGRPDQFAGNRATGKAETRRLLPAATRTAPHTASGIDLPGAKPAAVREPACEQFACGRPISQARRRYGIGAGAAAHGHL